MKALEVVMRAGIEDHPQLGRPGERVQHLENLLLAVGVVIGRKSDLQQVAAGIGGVIRHGQVLLQ